MSEWLAAAHHEAGHAIGYLHFGWRFEHVEIYDDDDGYVRGHVKVPGGTYNCEKRAVICMAGPMAECCFTGARLPDLCRGIGRVDLEMAREALGRLPDPPPLSAIVAQAKRLIASEWPRIGLVAEALAQRRRLDYAEFVTWLPAAASWSPWGSLTGERA